MVGDRRARHSRLARLHRLPQPPRAPARRAQGPLPRPRRRARHARARAARAGHPPAPHATAISRPSRPCSRSRRAASAERPAWLLDAYDRLGPGRQVRRAAAHRAALAGPRLRGRAARPGRQREGGARPARDGRRPPAPRTPTCARSRCARWRASPTRAPCEPLVEALKSAEVWLAPRIADILTRHGDAGGRAADRASRAARPPSGPRLGRQRAGRGPRPARLPGARPRPRRPRGRSARQVPPPPSAAWATAAPSPTCSNTCSPIPRPFVRARIAGALGQFDDPEVIDRLVRALGDPAWWVRMRSVEALEQIGAARRGAAAGRARRSRPRDPDAAPRSRSSGWACPGALVAHDRARTSGTAEAMRDADQVRQRRRPRAAGRAAAASVARGPDGRRRGHPPAGAARPGARAHRRRPRATPTPALRAAAFDALRGLRCSRRGPGGARRAWPTRGRGARRRHQLIGELGEAGGGGQAPRAAPPIRSRWCAPRRPARWACSARADAAADSPACCRDPAPEVREAAARAAADVRPAAGRSRGLIDCWATPTCRATGRRRGARRLGDPAAVPALVRAFDGADSALREAIVECGEPASTCEPLVRRCSTSLVGSARHGRQARRRSGPSAGSGPPRPRARSTGSRRTPSPRCARPRSRRLGRAGRRAGARRGRRRASHDPDDDVRAAALDAAAGCSCADQGQTLLGLLENDPSPARARARGARGRAPARPRGRGGHCSPPAVGRSRSAVRAAAALATRRLRAGEHRGARRRDAGRGRGAGASSASGSRTIPSTACSAASSRRPASLELRALGSLRPGGRPSSSLAEGMRSIARCARADPAHLRPPRLPGRAQPRRPAAGDPRRSQPRGPHRRTRRPSATCSTAEELLAAARRALGDPSLMVRRAAVVLFAPDRAGAARCPSLLQTLRADDDPAVLAAAAALAEGAFHTLRAISPLGMPRRRAEAVLVARVARLHPPSRPAPAAAGHGAERLRPRCARRSRRSGAHRRSWRTRGRSSALTRGPGDRPCGAQAAGAAGGGRALHDLLARMADDPDAEVRREVAVASPAPTGQPGRDEILARLAPTTGDARSAPRPYVGAPAAGHAGAAAARHRPRRGRRRRSGEVVASGGTSGGGAHRARRAAPARGRAGTRAARGRGRAARSPETDPVPAIRDRVSGRWTLAAAAREDRVKDAIIQRPHRRGARGAAGLPRLFPALQHLHARRSSSCRPGRCAGGWRAISSKTSTSSTRATCTKPLTMIVPAYNEEVTIVDSRHQPDPLRLSAVRDRRRQRRLDATERSSGSSRRSGSAAPTSPTARRSAPRRVRGDLRGDASRCRRP